MWVCLTHVERSIPGRDRVSLHEHGGDARMACGYGDTPHDRSVHLLRFPHANVPTRSHASASESAPGTAGGSGMRSSQNQLSGSFSSMTGCLVAEPSGIADESLTANPAVERSDRGMN